MTDNHCIIFNFLIVLGLLFGDSVRADERLFEVFNASNGLADNSAQTINCTYTGRMVISTIGHINFYDGADFSHVDSEQEDVYALSNYSGTYRIYFDKHHHLWLKDRHAVTCVNLTTESFVPEITDVFSELGVKSIVQDVFTDSENHLWLMSNNTLIGVDEQTTIPVAKGVKMQDMDVMGQRLYMFLQNGEVVCYSLKSGRVEYRADAFADGNEAAQYAQTSQLLQVGERFFQIRNGEKGSVLLCFDTHTRQWTALHSVPYRLNDMVKKDSVIYMAASEGYWTYDMQSQQKVHYAELTMTDGRKLHANVNCIEFDRQGGMWLGTEKRGLLYSRPHSSPFIMLPADAPQAREYIRMMDEMPLMDVSRYGRNVNCVCIDSRGWMWTGTLSGLKLHRMQSEPITLTHRDGLLNNVIHSVIEDDDHNIWVSTSGGITCFCIKKGQLENVYSYNRYDNVPAESFLNGRAMKLPDGTIVMQGIDHVVCFNPAMFTTLQSSDRFKFYPKLIRLLVNGNLIEAGTEIDGRVILEKAITRTREINLNYNQNTLALTFSGLNYFRPLQTYYRYRVRGYDEQWRVLSYFNSDGQVDMRGMFHLTLAALPPGEYVLEIQSSLYADVWNVEPVQLIIRINQPWWRSTGVYLLLFLIVAGLALTNLILYNRNYRMRVKRNNAEDDIVKRMRNFIERCNDNEEKLSPRYEEIYGQGTVDERIDVSPAFQQVMLSVAPYLQKHLTERVTMHELAEQAGLPVEQFYNIVSANLHKSPRMLALMLRLQHAAELLTTQPQLSIEDIALQCSFGSPNYFIATFFRQYRQTPKEYRAAVRS